MTMLRQIAFAIAAVAAGSVAQAADAGSGVSTGAQSGPSSAPTPHQTDATFAGYRFCQLLWAQIELCRREQLATLVAGLHN